MMSKNEHTVNVALNEKYNQQTENYKYLGLVINAPEEMEDDMNARMQDATKL